MSTVVSVRSGRVLPGRSALWMLAAGASATAAWVLYRFSPLEYHFYPRCILYTLTGIYCPGCGTLRAGHELLHGHVAAALGYNALLVVLLPFVVYALARRVVQALAGWRLPVYRLSGTQAKAVFWLVIAFTLLRNLPVFPLSVLAP